MAIIKCKMCGGDIELSADKTFGTCEYCGSTMTLPKVEDDQRAAQFNRGNHFRRSGEFDKALAIYERIVAENDDDAEAHWCCALCRFGIEYVEDPTTLEYLPTCHRASFDSFLEDVDYLAALEHSDGITKRQYQKDAAKIADVQKGILATSQNEEPFDVFICYKESDDATGQRTVDSTLAQDIYYQLTEEGYRVFFSRITLEDKVGTEYEPYIFAALNSAKVMVSIGTKPEHFNAVWVKNEWSRFLAMMRKDRSKLLLPCYRDMDPYDLPEQLSVLQSYDMSKIGFMQDLIRGIKKVLRKDEPKAEPVKETVVVQQAAGGSNVTALLKRGNMALEDGEWKQAKDYFDQVLNADAENAEAYLGLLLAEHKCAGLPQYVKEMKNTFCDKQAEKKVALQADEARIKAAEKEYALGDFLPAKEIRSVFSGFDFIYPSYVKSSIQNRKDAEMEMNAEKNLVRARQFAFGELKQKLESTAVDILKHYDALAEQAQKDETAAAEQKRQAYVKFLTQAEEETRARYDHACAIREKDYQTAVQVQEKADTPEAYEGAARLLRALNGYQDSAERENACREAAARLKTEQQTKEAAAAKKKKKVFAAVSGAVAVVAAAIVLTITVFIPNGKYHAAVKLMKAGKYEDAIIAFTAMDGYKDSNDQIAACRYNAAVSLMNDGKYIEAITAFQAANGYKDSYEKIAACQHGNDYNAALSLMNAGKYKDAIAAFKNLGGYKDSAEQISVCETALYDEASTLMNAGQYEEAITAFKNLGGYKDSANQITACQTALKDVAYDAAVAQIYDGQNIDEFIQAYEQLLALQGYKDSAEIVERFSDKYEMLTFDIGDTIFLGSYEQDGVSSNGKEQIEWELIAREGEKALIVSKRALDCKEYDESNRKRSWEDCSLRKWLNETFLKTTFSEEEQAKIVTTSIGAADDKIFILSNKEVKQYFSSEFDRRCAPTAYGKQQGVKTSKDVLVEYSYHTCRWWLRNDDKNEHTAAVFYSGTINSSDYSANDAGIGVRPAMWINLEG